MNQLLFTLKEETLITIKKNWSVFKNITKFTLETHSQKAISIKEKIETNLCNYGWNAHLFLKLTDTSCFTGRFKDHFKKYPYVLILANHTNCCLNYCLFKVLLLMMQIFPPGSSGVPWFFLAFLFSHDFRLSLTNSTGKYIEIFTMISHKLLINLEKTDIFTVSSNA